MNVSREVFSSICGLESLAWLCKILTSCGLSRSTGSSHLFSQDKGPIESWNNDVIISADLAAAFISAGAFEEAFLGTKSWPNLISTGTPSPLHRLTPSLFQ